MVRVGADGTASAAGMSFCLFLLGLADGIASVCMPFTYLTPEWGCLSVLPAIEQGVEPGLVLAHPG
jgi:hypothetical protein